MGSPPSDDSPVRLAVRTARNAWRDLRRRESPVTAWLVGTLCVAFLAQRLAATATDASLREVTTSLYLEYPALAWSIGAFLHGDLLHLVGNVAAVGFLGRVLEDSFSTPGYLAFLTGAAVVSGLGAYALQAPFTDATVVAYGASGLGFALGGFALSLPLRARSVRFEDLVVALTAAEGVAVLLGLSAVATVLTDLATGPYLSARWANGAHAAGAAYGLVVGVRRATRREG